MDKKDIAIVAVLIALLLAWPSIDRRLIRPLLGPAPAPTRTEQTNAVPSEPAAAPELHAAAGHPRPAAETPASIPVPTAVFPPARGDYGRELVLENDHLSVRVCSYAGAVREAVLKQYPARAETGAPPVRLDFTEVPAAGWYWGGLTAPQTAYFEPSQVGPSSVVWTARSGGLDLTRKISLGQGYLLTLEDRISVPAGAVTAAVPRQVITLGLMRKEAGRGRYAFLGMDILRAGGEGVVHLASRIPRLFGAERKRQGLAFVPLQIAVPVVTGELAVADWAAVKNKYFVQVARVEPGIDEVWLLARRRPAAGETPSEPSSRRMTAVMDVGGALVFHPLELDPGETVVRRVYYYVGPKKYSALAALGYRAAEIMEFGIWTPISRLLLWTLNLIHDHVWPHNYGLAIMLLTVLIRIVFWPITHASTVSMKRLQEIQPLINEVRLKYKDNPQKQQKEMMAIYREHKVNPLGGCLPMLIQIPVFIALFVVLRSAIELRFASFLWIRDLSEPEGLLADVLPIPLNILPLLMALTMYWQQKLTPSGADTQQQKMMAFFPLLMLVFLYNFPSGLVLYWTTNQCLMIVQQLTIRHQLHVESPRLAPGRISGGEQ